MNDEQIRLEGIVHSRKPMDECLSFEINVGDKRYRCFDATGEMDAFAALPGQHLVCYGRWSLAVIDVFEVERVEKLA
jgi:hypothetical protein